MDHTSLINPPTHHLPHHQTSPHHSRPHQTPRPLQPAHTNHPTPTNQQSRNMPVNPLDKRYYHGRITREEAEARLRNSGCHQGMFLLRESLGREGNYALSLCYKEDVYHYSIERHHDGTVAIRDGKNFAGPVELINNHMHREDGLLCRLVSPCNLADGVSARAFHDMDHKDIEASLFELAKREGMDPNIIKKTFHSTQRSQLERALKKIMHQDKPWFHGKMSREEAENRILASGLQEGKYLVRERNEEGSFALSLCYNNFVYHYKIDKDCTGQLSIKEGPKFDSLIQMTDHYTLKKDGLLCCLHHPCSTQRRHSDIPTPPRPGPGTVAGRTWSMEDSHGRSPPIGRPLPPPKSPNRDRMTGLGYNAQLGMSMSSPLVSGRSHEPHLPPRDRVNSNVTHVMGGAGGPWDEPEHEEDLPSAGHRPYRPDDDNKIYGEPNDQEKIYDYLAKNKTTKRLDQTCLNLGEQVGKGNFGSVLKGTCMVNNQLIPVAVKTLKADLGIPNSEPEIMKEAELMAGLDHPHIVRMIGICHGTEMMLVLELADLGPLHKYLKKHQEMSERNVLELMYQVAQGMCYLESRQFVHRDLAARNVLLVTETFAKISDFGMSKALGLDSQYYVAETAGKWPLKWYAPECIYKFKFSSKSDVWSYGVTMWEAMSYGKRPYAHMKGQELMQFIENGDRLAQPDRCPDAVYALMKKCWQAESQDRPNFREIESMMKDVLQSVKSGTLRVR